MSDKHEETSSSCSSSSSLPSSHDNESILSDALSVAPAANYQSTLPNVDLPVSPMIQGPGKLIRRHNPDLDSSGDSLEVEQRNGESHMKSREALYQNGLGHLDNVDVQLESGGRQNNTAASHEEIGVGRPSETGHGLAHASKSQPVLRDISSVQAQDIPTTVPRRQLLATTSAPVRLRVHDFEKVINSQHKHETPVDCHHGPESDSSSSHSSKSDMQAMSDQTGGRNGGTAPGCSGTERALVRTLSLPSRSFSEVEDTNGYRRTNTQNVRRGKNNENRNVRLAVQEKMSERRKKKLIKKLAPVNVNGVVEFDEAGSKRIASFLAAGGAGIFDEGGEVGEEDKSEEEEDTTRREVPPLQIVMLIVGTRGDVQPFVAIGKHLQGYGHRVRLATHSNFREFVMTAGLEFYPLGGDPKVLAGYMVKNKGFLPSGPSEVQVQRKQIKSIIHSLLPACTAADPEAGSGLPFRAQAIIANPPAYGHVHVAEYLQVPLHIFFTMPWTATSEFPHPLSRVKSPAGYRMSYQVVDSLIWWGIRSMINDFRKKKLKLRPITYLSGSQGSIAELPTGYIWSPHLVPKPRDWGPLIDVVGFCFLNLAQDYKPPQDLLTWLGNGAPPIYVGFGSLPVVDPKGMTEIIVKALKMTKQRGIIFKGWGGIGDLQEAGEDIFLIEDCPHDWLFKQCVAVVHHGGAGTTAAGLKAACPTTVVPFFGDQPFWGERIHAKGVGPPPIPVDQFSLDKLVKAIDFMLKDEVKQRALDIAKAMEGEDGVDGAVKAFHKHLPRDTPPPVCTNSTHRIRHKVFKPFRSVYNCFI